MPPTGGWSPRLNERTTDTRSYTRSSFGLFRQRLMGCGSKFSQTAKAAPQISLSRPVAYLCSRLAINV